MTKNVFGAKHLFFDMDGTLTPSRSKIDNDMKNKLATLARVMDVVIVSGATFEQINKQIPSRLWRMAQNGNDTRNPEGSILWRNELQWWHIRDILDYVTKLMEVSHYDRANPFDMVECRGCQISFSFVGHHEDIETKKKFDPDRSKRRDILKKYPFENEEIEVVIGGTTCLDFYLKGHSKGDNVLNLAHYKGWPLEDCLYIGDAFWMEGNDSTLMGKMDFLEVENIEDTRDFIQEIIKEAGIKVK